MKGYSLRDARRLANGSRDWREAIWNKWLVGYLTPRPPEGGGGDGVSAQAGTSAAVAGGSAAPGPRQSVDSAGDSVAPSAAGGPLAEAAVASSAVASSTVASSAVASSTVASSQVVGHTDPLRPDRSSRDQRFEDVTEFTGARRAQAVRARLDHLLEQMDTLEVAVDRIAERQSVAASHDRLQLRSVTDILARLMETQERHTESLIACTRALERLERRVMWAERNGRPLASLADDLAFDLRSARDVVSRDVVSRDGVSRDGVSRDVVSRDGVPRDGVPRDTFGDVVGAETIVPPSMTQRVRRPAEGPRSSGDASAPLGGKLSDISLPTLLSMAELEGWTGRLTLEVQNDTVLIDLDGGLLVSVFEDDSPSDAVEALYHLIETRDGRFTFTPLATVTKTELAPMTVGTLLLRASHRRDELSRVEVGS